MRSFSEQLNAIRHYKKHSSNPEEIQKLIDAAEKIDRLAPAGAIKVRELVGEMYSRISLAKKKAKEGSAPKTEADKNDLTSIAGRIRKEKGVSWLKAKQLAAKELVDIRAAEEREALRQFNIQFRDKLKAATKGVKDKNQDAHRYAQPPGKHVSQSGKSYTERRANRTDLSGRKKFPML